MMKQMILNIRKNVLIKNSFGIKSKSSFFVEPRTIDEIFDCLKFAKENKLLLNILGKGTNTLICKDKIKGLIIKIDKNLSKHQIQGEIITFQSGVELSEASRIALNQGLSGLEFAEGIPGTIGGAIFGNSGAFGESIGALVQKVKIIDIDKLILKERKNLKFSHRNSNLKINKDIIVEVELKLEKKNKKFIKEKMDFFREKRKQSQPKEKSVGCIFKNNQAGKIIDELGLKGTKIGNAEISNKHANFVVNKGNATGFDVLELIRIIKKKAKEEKNINLDLEINILK
ncbi:MAG: UDP-N-acetylmuramate dehydrogenase [Nanoarchaeota archaeon]|nr:UDP-N-acetylmuramate dehydrogenase [Nanoarchaeota archaeon]MBU1850443.1 UDP-N-acetylmuramate dehydrogenase [Nanoarchaeota archaeon]